MRIVSDKSREGNQNTRGVQ